MKTIILLTFLMLSASCVTTKMSLLPEDELFQTRKFVGVFDTVYHESARFGDPSLIWIRTDMEETFGIISAFGRSCDFDKGELLYIRRIYYSPGITSGYWMYQIEGRNSGEFYRLSSFQYDNKVLIQVWF